MANTDHTDPPTPCSAAPAAPPASTGRLVVPAAVVAQQADLDTRTVVSRARLAGMPITKIGARWFMRAADAAAFLVTT